MTMHASSKSKKHLFWNRLLPLIAWFPVFWIAFVVGCTTHAKRIASLRHSFHKGDLEAATREADRLLEKNKRDSVLVELDQSLVRLANAEPAKTEATLRDVRNQFAAKHPWDDLENMTSLMVDDQSRPFQPDDYEKLFVLMFLAISNLLQDGDDAHAYANQIANLQSEIEQNINRSNSRIRQTSTEYDAREASAISGSLPSMSAKSNPDEFMPVTFKQIALAPFISGILHEQSHRDYDSAARYYFKTIEFNSEFEEARLGLERAQNGHHSKKGNGVLYVFAAVGKGPYKVEKAEVPTSQAILIADRILSAIGDHTLPPTIAPIKISQVVVPVNNVSNLRVSIADLSGVTGTVTDLGQIAKEQYAAKYNAQMARAIVRRIVKKGAIYAGKDALGTENKSWADLLINVGGVIWEATESADTRCWGLLPEKIQVLRVELPVGRHQLGLSAIAGKLETETYFADVEIRDGANTYAYACFPSDKLAGKILVSQPQ